MGLFSKGNEISKAMDIYNKAKDGLLRGKFIKRSSLDSIEMKNCMIRLVKEDGENYSIHISTGSNENYTITLVD